MTSRQPQHRHRSRKTRFELSRPLLLAEPEDGQPDAGPPPDSAAVTYDQARERLLRQLERTV